jgi:hypothetical protein
VARVCSFRTFVTLIRRVQAASPPAPRTATGHPTLSNLHPRPSPDPSRTTTECTATRLRRAPKQTCVPRRRVLPLGMTKPTFVRELFRGRPTELDLGLAREIIEAIMNGYSLSNVCDTDRDMPTPGTFLSWTRQDEGLRKLYEEALEVRNDVLVEELLAASDHPDAVRGRLQVDARKWIAERLAPGKYAPRSMTTTKPEELSASASWADDVRRRVEKMADEAVKRAARDAAA